ncbi:copper resistance protein [Lelliottia amnigena]|uniref:copper resistance protein n=1 Tax=Lelliottia amnigena TaxID=61646 RepID=UPI001157818D
MIPRQRKAFFLVALACLVVLVCNTQRMAGLHALVMNAASVAQQTVKQTGDSDAPVTPCELSAKSLLATPPIMFEGALFAITLVLAVLAAVPHRPVRRWPPSVISPPRLRVHLRLCVFRE